LSNSLGLHGNHFALDILDEGSWSSTVDVSESVMFLG
jgi:hypothetical protein